MTVGRALNIFVLDGKYFSDRGPVGGWRRRRRSLRCGPVDLREIPSLSPGEAYDGPISSLESSTLRRVERARTVESLGSQIRIRWGHWTDPSLVRRIKRFAPHTLGAVPLSTLDPVYYNFTCIPM